MTQPASAPCSPMGQPTDGGPVTPQRFRVAPRGSHSRAVTQSQPHSHSLSFGNFHTPAVAHSAKALVHRSPLTPASSMSPYTPLSNRSLASSVLTTPVSASSASKAAYAQNGASSFEQDSTQALHEREDNEKSIADAADNWRARAGQHGITVAKGDNDDHFGENRSHHTASRHSNNETLLPAPFMSTHRRPRAHTTASLPPSSLQISNHTRSNTHTRSSTATSQSAYMDPVSPFSRRTLADLNLATPPRAAAYAKTLNLQGARTDPPGARRRSALTFSQTELSNIDENAYPVPSAPHGHPISPLATRARGHSKARSPAMIDAAEEEEFHARVTAPTPLNAAYPVFGSTKRDAQETFSPNFTSSPPPSHSRSQSTASSAYPASSASSGVSAVSRSASSASNTDSLTQTQPVNCSAPTSCATCARTPASLAVLEPCEHALCAACLTSALNIAGEKDVGCGVCGSKVDEFHLEVAAKVEQGGKRPLNPSDNPFSPAALLPSPALETRESGQGNTVVLRIDNVPWDITPPALLAFLSPYATRAHVLLDPRGKTLSHAFAELPGEDAARAALRKAQNAVLGRGKRARGVTVTRTGMGELMSALFPSWKGSFKGATPSLGGLDQMTVMHTLGAGLLSVTELNALLALVKAPDSHFLKVPELPYYSLISILSKFPADVDSRVFWSNGIRDMLFDVTMVAIQALIPRVEDPKTDATPELLAELITTALECQAFTSSQIRKISTYLSPPSSPQSTSTRTNTPLEHLSDRSLSESPVGALAREFGVDEAMVHALAQRLAAYA